MNRGFRRCAIPLLFLGLAPGGCGGRAADGLIPPACRSLTEDTRYYPQSIDSDIDLLFVISTSSAMQASQQHLAEQLPRLIEGLRNPRLGGPGCSPSTREACRIPSLRIGVISADLGAGNFDLPGCRPGGDAAKLQTTPRVAGCALPAGRWISYDQGVANVSPVGEDGVALVKEAFSCIAQLGANGCRFQQPLEAARRALDPGLNLNPGFLRKDAFLAIVFIGSEDDCSVAKPQLFDPSQLGLSDRLGPLTPFRCTEFGIQCDKNGRLPGVRKQCRPGFDWLVPVERYWQELAALKPPGRVMAFALAGPSQPFEVGLDGEAPILKPSCQSQHGVAVPAVRLEFVMNRFDERGHFNRGLDDQGRPIEVNLCSPDFGPVLRYLGETIVATDSFACLPRPPLTRSCGLACVQGDELGPGTTCRTSCLDQADCVVVEVARQGTPEETSLLIPRCPEAVSPGSACTACPCWRLRRSLSCTARGSPYELQIFRRGDAPKGAVAVLHCSVSEHPWGSAELAATPQCL